MLHAGQMFKPEQAVEAEEHGLWRVARFGAQSHETGGDIAVSLSLRGRPIVDRLDQFGEQAALAKEFRATPEYAAYVAACDRLADHNRRIEAAKVKLEEASEAFKTDRSKKATEAYMDADAAVPGLRNGTKLLTDQVRDARAAAEQAWKRFINGGRFAIQEQAIRQRDEALAEFLRVAGPLLDKIVIAQSTVDDCARERSLEFGLAGLALAEAAALAEITPRMLTTPSAVRPAYGGMVAR